MDYKVGDWIPLLDWTRLPSVGGLYVIRNIVNGKEYVGKSVNVHRRMSDHVNMPYPDKYLYRSISKHGLANFECCLHVEVSDETHCLELEVLLIAERNSFVPHGFNLTRGGEGATGWKPSEEARENMRKGQLGRTHPEEVREKMSNWHTLNSPSRGTTLSEERKKEIGIFTTQRNLGSTWSENQRVRFTKARKGVTTRMVISDEHRAAISLAQKGVPKPSLSVRNRGSGNPMYGKKSPNRKEIFLWEVDSLTPKIFKSNTELAEYLKVRPCSITDWCVGRYRTKLQVAVAYA